MRIGQLSAAVGFLVAPWLAVRLDLPSRFMGTQQAPLANIDVDNSGYPLERGACLTISLGPAAAAECGNLRIVHQLPSIRTFNKPRTPTLIYNSEFAHPYPAVPVQVTITSTTTTPVSVEAELKIQIAGVYQSRAIRTWPGSEWPANQTTTRRITVTYDGISDTTGYYPYQVIVTNIYPGGVRLPAPAATGKMFLINRSQTTGFGAGWWLAGLERIKNHTPTAFEIMWVGGDGSARFFLKHWSLPNTWYTPLYDKADTLYYNGSSTWTKTDAEGVRTKFNSAGEHTQTIDRFGRITQFAYTSGRLSMITLPAPASSTYQFYNTSGRLDSVVAPFGTVKRTTKVTNPAGQITAIRNPGDSMVSFAYLAGADLNLMSSRTNRRLVVNSFTYDSGRRVRSSRIAMSPGADIVDTLYAGETRGTANTGSPSSVDTAKVYTLLNGPRPLPTADTVRMFQSRFGPPRRLINALTQETLIRQGPDCGGFACGWLPNRIKTPRGRITLAVYDTRGNPTHLIDSVTPVAGQRDTTRYGWDGKFDQITKIVPPQRDSMVFSVSPTNGRREWMQDARGDTGRVVFGYHPNFPEEVVSMTLPLVNGVAATYNYTSDTTRRNLKTVRTPRLFTTTYVTDTIGRLIRVETPVDTLTSPAKRREQRTGYDLLDRPIADTTSTVGFATTETIYVRTFYNAEGRPDSVRRWTNPDPEAIGILRNKWRYDKADRVVAEMAPDTLTIATDTLADSTVYDEAGNRTKLISRRFRGAAGPFIVMAYNQANQMFQRTIQGYSRAAPPWSFSAEPQEVLTLRSYPYVIPDDVQDFTYNADGALLTADNRYARITRQYDTLGRVRSETQQIATVEETFSGHSYTLNYGYDRNGRLLSTEVPSIFAIGSRDSIEYLYHPRIDDIVKVKGVASDSFLYTYNRRREDSLLVYPGAYSRFAVWDGDGNPLIDSIRNTGGTSGDRWPYADVRRVSGRLFDGTGKLWRSIDRSFFGDSAKATYRGLGLLLTSRFHQSGDNQLHKPVEYGSKDSVVMDPLGNISVLIRSDSINDGSGWLKYSLLDTTYAYRAGTGRLVWLNATAYHHDLAGNLHFESQLLAVGKRERAATYDAAGVLRASDQKTVYYPGGRRAFEEYRYDALGRRVWVRMVSGCPPSERAVECHTPYVRRTIWHGNQELAEMQAPGSDTTAQSVREQDSGPFTLTFHLDDWPDPNRFYGQVLYIPGGAVDAPRSVTRYNYTDTDSSQTQRTWPTQTIVPFWNREGLPSVGAFADGKVDKSYNGTAGCTTANVGAARCYLIEWLGARSAWDLRNGNGERKYWHGSLLDGKRDVSGLDYRRNRYYDPAASRFTQEDPIGLAGGLNLYGFANGDPVNFSDPFGLCPPADNNISDCPADQKFIHLTSGALRARASQTVDDYITLATTIGTGGEGAALAAAGGTGRVVIGETMERVISYGQKVGANWYKARGKNAANWLRNNMQWLRRQMKAGKEVIDIGEDAARAERSSAYAAEKALLERTGYPTTSVPPP